MQPRGVLLAVDPVSGDLTAVSADSEAPRQLASWRRSGPVGPEDQLERLRGLECDRAQGWLLGRPVPATVLTQEWTSATT